MKIKWPLMLTAMTVSISIVVYYFAAESRALFLSETGYWFYSILNYESVEYKHGSLRLLDIAWQLFGILYAKYAQSPTLSGGFNVLTVAYLTPQILSPIVSYLVLKRYQNTRFIVFQLLYWAVIGLSSSIFLVNTATIGAAFFWPVLYFLVFTSAPKLTSQVFGILATIAVIMSHESNMVLVAMIAAVLFFGRSKLSANVYKVWMLLAAVGFFIMLRNSFNYWFYKSEVIGSDFRNIILFNAHWGSSWRAASLISMSTIVAAHVLVILKRFDGRYLEVFRQIWVGGAIFVLSTIYGGNIAQRSDRVFVAITCAAMSVLCFYFARKGQDLFKSKGFEVAVQAFVIAMIFSAAAQFKSFDSFNKRYVQAKKDFETIPAGTCVIDTSNRFDPGAHVILVLLDYPDNHLPDRVYFKKNSNWPDPCLAAMNARNPIFQVQAEASAVPKVVDFSKIKKTVVW